MLTDRSSSWLPMRAVAVVIAAALAGTLLSPVAPTAADPVQTAESAIGAGMVSDPADYQAPEIPAVGDGDGDIEVEEVENLGEGACAPLPAVVSQVDIEAALAGGPPSTGAGRWQYEVCAENAARARAIAAANPTAARAKRYCGPPYQEGDICAVYVRWRPEIPPPPPPAGGGRKGYLDSLDNFAPDLQTSPGLEEDRGLIANLPTWFWNTVRTEVPKVVPGGSAWHLRTTFRIDGREVCGVSGLRKVGTIYQPGRHRPEQPSPSNCGHTFTNQGRYEIRGCTRWLFIIEVGVGFAAVVLVFAVTFCDSDTVPVKETQVLTGGDPRRHRVS